MERRELFRSLASSFSKKEKQHISHKLGKKVGQLDHVMDRDGKLFIKKGKKLKEILGE